MQDAQEHERLTRGAVRVGDTSRTVLFCDRSFSNMTFFPLSEFTLVMVVPTSLAGIDSTHIIGVLLCGGCDKIRCEKLTQTVHASRSYIYMCVCFLVVLIKMGRDRQGF